MTETAALAFLSRLFGGEVVGTVVGGKGFFLSRLFGGEDY